jgi:nucleotide-binding universal stress UspA family protein
VKTRRILVALDGSEGSDAALREGLELAAGLKAAVTLVSVTKAPSGVLGDPYYQRALSDSLHRGRDVLSSALRTAEDAGITADYELIEGDAAVEIVSLAEARGADMIVIGSRGLGAVAGTLLGSVSHHVVHHATVPVLVVRAAATATAGEAA